MSNYSEAADQVVRMSLNGVEMAARISGQGAKELAKLLYTLAKEQQKSRGKTRLSSLLHSGKELKVFAVRDNELEIFSRAAKKYGVLYCVLRDKDASDGLTDIMVRAEDASKVNRIFQRFNMSAVSTADIQNQMREIGRQQVREQPSQENPTTARRTRNAPSEVSSERSELPETTFDDPAYDRPSVRVQLREIRMMQKKQHGAPEQVIDDVRKVIPKPAEHER